jgi:hypothetical protein
MGNAEYISDGTKYGNLIVPAVMRKEELTL